MNGQSEPNSAPSNGVFERSRIRENPATLGAVSLFHPHPIYEGRTKVKIMNPEVVDIVEGFTLDALKRQFPDSQEFTDPILILYTKRSNQPSLKHRNHVLFEA